MNHTLVAMAVHRVAECSVAWSTWMSVCACLGLSLQVLQDKLKELKETTKAFFSRLKQNRDILSEGCAAAEGHTVYK